MKPRAAQMSPPRARELQVRIAFREPAPARRERVERELGAWWDRFFNRLEREGKLKL